MLLILCSQHAPRLLYTVGWICSQWQISFEITDDPERFSAFKGAKINYRDQYQDAQALSVFPSGLLYSTDLERVDILFGRIGEMPVLFKNESDLGFDVFSAVFFMLSRYEEYLPFAPDKHGRFSAQNSMAARYGFVNVPVADIWIAYLKTTLQKQFPELRFCKNEFDAIPTYDIDVAYKYKGKSFLKNTGGLFRDIFNLSLRNVKVRMGVISGFIKDPWDTYSGIISDFNGKDLRPVFFIPAAKRSAFDNNLSPGLSIVQRLINMLRSYGEIGLHPSYYTTEKPALVSQEKDALEKVLDEELIVSRQHFLKFKLPGTYQALIASGITTDYSMAFPDMPGFRAGTAQPFYFYDLKNERQTALKLFPPCCMDQTFIHYVKYDAAKSLETMKALLHTVRDVNGVFIPVFHNHCLEDENWRFIHKELIEEMNLMKNKSS